LVPRNGTLYNSRAKIREKIKQWDACSADYSKAIEHESFNPIFYYSRGKFRITRGDFPGAIKDHTRALELIYQLSRPTIPIYKSDFNIKIYEFGKQLWKMSFADNFYHRGIAKYRLGDFKNALIDFEEIREWECFLENTTPKIFYMQIFSIDNSFPVCYLLILNELYILR